MAAFTRQLYGATFSEPGGVPSIAGMDGNVLAFTPTALVQLTAPVLTLLPGRTMSH